MNEFIKGGLWMMAGVIIGATGAGFLSKRDSLFRGIVVGTLSQGISIKEKVATSMEKAKENVEDIVAEARHTHHVKSQVADDSDKASS